jgi:hypothetical protein
MQSFKLLFAMMLAVSMMELRSASEGDYTASPMPTILEPTDASCVFSPRTSLSSKSLSAAQVTRTRTSSKELMDEMNRQMIERSACPKYQFAGIIESFQKNQIQPIMTNVKPGKHSSIQTRYQALSSFAAQLSACRATLENRATTESIETIAQVVHNQLQGYKNNSGKIDIVVRSTHFLNIERKCDDIISGTNR